MAPTAVPFLTQFAALRDPRQSGKVLYPLPELLLLLLCGTVAGADDFVELTLWGTEHLAIRTCSGHASPTGSSGCA